MVRKCTKSKKHRFENVRDLYFPVRESFLCPQFCDIKGYEFSAENFLVKRKIYNRNLIVATTIYIDKAVDDELYSGKKKVVLSFFLPTGSYATMIIKQLFLRLKNK